MNIGTEVVQMKHILSAIRPRPMKHFFLVLAIGCCFSVPRTRAADFLAEVSYRRRPAFLNGEHMTGVWHLVPGDTVTTGDGRAYVTAKYLNRTRVGVMPNAKVIFQPGWVDLITHVRRSGRRCFPWQIVSSRRSLDSAV